MWQSPGTKCSRSTKTKRNKTYASNDEIINDEI